MFVVDLGCIVIGTTTEVTVMVENNGFIPADMTLSTSVSDKTLKHNGFYITFQNHIGLPVGRTVPLYLTIKPMFSRYCNKEECIRFTIRLQVSRIVC